MSIPNVDDCFDANFRMRSWLRGGYDWVFFAKEPCFCGALLQMRPEEVSVSVPNEHVVMGYYVCIWIYVYTYICICVYMYICIYVYYICICVYMYTCVYASKVCMFVIMGYYVCI